MASNIIYLEGKAIDDETILVPLSSAALLFVVQYCSPESFSLKFTRKNLDEAYCFKISRDTLDKTEHVFDTDDEQDCLLPVIRQTDDIWVRSGLCGTIRYIVSQAHIDRPQEHLDDLLGFRGGSLKACAEVSGWTKLCEVELPDTVTQLVNKIRNEESKVFSLPEDLMKLEWHFLKPPKIHNDDKTKRPFLKQIQKEADNLKTEEDVTEFQYNREIHNPHGVTKFYVNVNAEYETVRSKTNNRNIKYRKEKKSNSVINGGSDGEIVQDNSSVNNLKNLLKKMTIDNLEFSHLYSEGTTITMADLILYTNIYHLFESFDFKIASVQHHLKHIITWFDHMTSLPRVHQTAIQCGYKLGKLAKNRNMTSPIEFTVEEGLFEKINEDEMELSRMSRGKYRPIKPDVWSALDKVVKGEIQIETGIHPRGDNTAILWSEVPEGVDPGLDLPKKRLLRKCEQLENLVTAVLELAKPRDVIVDFCSGGGHLGIAVAHFLPECKVYLIENKEESLIRAKQRINKLNMKNVVIYQCNQDYFRGKFDIGMCLHACGVATDMVLKQCLQNNASFVICPCCYGGIQNTHLMTYPTSKYYKDSGIVYKDFLTLGHAADQTEFKLVLEEQGKYCANLVDTDRAALAKEHGYKVTLCSLNPLTCTPKNNLLIGIAPEQKTEPS
ncbi:glutathione S-transferase C-terminal domain-containing protein-like [Mytilus galloprovincialis]|uniref:glutathione S-transferase C-terminal domain-containing protein-like n=1 Tax=Mytilus galloprovincialis TaxID=29158 RepID=UPI003F7C41F9